MSNVRVITPAKPSIRCAHCKQTHTSVEDVRACFEIEQMHKETCVHGLAAWLCADPVNHYPADNEGWL